MSDEIKNLPHSIRDRLHNHAKETKRPFAEVLQYYGMERFLYRLSCSKYKDNFILKGALMFAVWDIADRRTTIDIDFIAHYDNRVDRIVSVIKEICNEKVIADGLVFSADTVKGQQIRETADYGGIRVKLTGYLERARIPIQIDTAFGDIVYPGPELIEFPVILDLPNPQLKGYSPESAASEKLETIIKLGSLNSRMKDFYDLWVMLRRFKFDAARLVLAISKTFNHRNTPIPRSLPLFHEEIYDANSDRQHLWKSFLIKEEIVKAPEELHMVAGEIEKFFIEHIKLIKR